MMDRAQAIEAVMARLLARRGTPEPEWHALLADPAWRPGLDRFIADASAMIGGTIAAAGDPRSGGAIPGRGAACRSLTRAFVAWLRADTKQLMFLRREARRAGADRGVTPLIEGAHSLIGYRVPASHASERAWADADAAERALLAAAHASVFSRGLEVVLGYEPDPGVPTGLFDRFAIGLARWLQVSPARRRLIEDILTGALDAHGAAPVTAVVAGSGPANDAAGGLQALIDGTPAGGTLVLSPREYRGPARVSRPLTIEGRGATVWALHGPVLEVAAADVTLRDVRIEVTDEASELASGEGTALVAAWPLSFESVAVRGTVEGVPAEAGAWCYPSSLFVGAIGAMAPLELAIRIVVPVPCRLVSCICGLALAPAELAPGAHEVALRFDALAADTLINGVIAIETAHLRRTIVVSGHVARPDDGPVEAWRERVIWAPAAEVAEVAPPVAEMREGPPPAATGVFTLSPGFTGGRGIKVLAGDGAPTREPPRSSPPSPPSPPPARPLQGRLFDAGEQPLGPLFSGPNSAGRKEGGSPPSVPPLEAPGKPGILGEAFLRREPGDSG